MFCSGSYLFSGAIQNWPTACGAMCHYLQRRRAGPCFGVEAEPLHWHSIDTLSKYLNDYKGKRRPYKGRSSSPNFRENWLKKWSPQHHWLWPGWTYPAVRQLGNLSHYDAYLFKVKKREKTETTSGELVRDCFKRGDIYLKWKTATSALRKSGEDDHVIKVPRTWIGRQDQDQLTTASMLSSLTCRHSLIMVSLFGKDTLM